MSLVGGRRWQRVRTLLEPRLGVDARALGAVRIGLGVLLLADLAIRTSSLRAHYTDAGILPRWALLTERSALSVHLAAGSVELVGALFAVQALVAVALLVGYRTRIASVLVWLLWASLHARMPLVLNGGDTLLRLVLFWAMFAPMGARFSVDALRTGGREGRILSVGTVGLLCQVVVMYAANVAMKHDGDVWLRGDGLAYAMSLEQFTTPIGDALAGMPGVMLALNWAIVVLWTAAPLLILLTWWPRAALAAAFVGAHLGMFLTMHLVLFPFVAVVALLAFLPPVVWDRLIPGDTDRWTPSWARTVAQRGSVGLSFTDDDVTRRARRGVRLTALAVAVTSLVFVGLWNVQLVDDRTNYSTEHRDVVPQQLSTWGETMQLTQYWTMFAPDPLRDDGWYVMPGRLTNGTKVDIYRGGAPVSYDKPADVSAQYGDARSRKYMMNLWQRSYSDYRLYYGQYHCREWNREHDVKLETFQMVYVLEQTGSDGDEPPEERTIWRHDCFGG